MEVFYRTKGVCSSSVRFSLDGGIVSNVIFSGGCSGNLQGIAALCEGKPASELMKTLKGICCGDKATSCPDQLASAIKKVLEEQKDAAGE